MSEAQTVVKELVLETEHHPMSEGMFDVLSNVSGFNNLNGATYSDHVKAWALRQKASSSDSHDVGLKG